MYESLLKRINNRLLSIEDGKPLIDAGGGPPAHVVPEKYEFAKVGEGEKATDVDADTVKAVSEYAKEHKLSQAQAQAHMNQTLTFSEKLKSSAVVVPEKYEFAKIKTKDAKGADIEVDVAKEISEPIAAFAKENGFTQAQAQKFLDREIAATEQANADYQKQTDDLVKGWRDEAKKDPVLSAGNFEANLGTAKKALDQFFPGLAKNVSDHMFLDHPMILRGLYEIGKKIGEDGEIITGKNTDQEKAPEMRMFPTMAKK